MTADPPHWREVRDRLTAKRDSPSPEPLQRPPAPMTIEQVEAIVSVLAVLAKHAISLAR